MTGCAVPNNHDSSHEKGGNSGNVKTLINSKLCKVVRSRCSRVDIVQSNLRSIARHLGIAVCVIYGMTVAISAILYWKEFTSNVNKCATSTSVWESYYKIEMSDEIEEQFPDYKLYVAGELFTEKIYMHKNFSFHNSKESLNGVPILFIPGNCGFHEQGRTISSILTHMIESRGLVHTGIHFDYFTIDFNEESLALSGHYLFRARAFAEASILRIRTLYKTPKKILLIGHSIGGLIGRSLDSYGSLSDTLVTIATPHLLPVVYTDSLIETFYREMLKTPSENKFLVSFAAGRRDFTVPGHLTRLPNMNSTFTRHHSFEAIPKAHQSADHVASSFCNSASIVISRMIFDWVDWHRMRFEMEEDKRDAVFNYHFIRNPGGKSIHSENVSNIPWMADEHCVRIGEHSRAFYFLSDATADNFICGQKTVGNHNRMELLNPNVFSALPPFEKTKNVKGVTERLVALNRYAEIDANWLRSKNYTKLCLPEIEQMSDEPFEVGYAFNADHNLGDVELSAAVERVFEVYPDVLLGYLEVTGVQKSFHVFEVNVEAGCWDAFFIYKGEDGSVPYKLNEGDNHLLLVSWLPYSSFTLKTVKPIGCPVSFKLSNSIFGWFHYIRSQVTSLPTYLLIIIMILLHCNIADHFEGILPSSCFKLNFFLELMFTIAVTSSLSIMMRGFKKEETALSSFDLKFAVDEELFQNWTPIIMFITGWVVIALLVLIVEFLVELLCFVIPFTKLILILRPIFKFNTSIFQMVLLTFLSYVFPSLAAVLSLALLFLLTIRCSLSEFRCKSIRESLCSMLKRSSVDSCQINQAKCEKLVLGAHIISDSEVRLHKLGFLFCCINSLPNVLFMVALLKDKQPNYIYSDPTFPNAVACIFVYCTHLAVKLVSPDTCKAHLANFRFYHNRLISKIVSVIFLCGIYFSFVCYLYRLHKLLVANTVLYLMLIVNYVVVSGGKVSELYKKCK
ncbi:uncharacterized protein LOC142344800 isoform X2 [Convolutriloba macropyga]|uniref:uncharacterized protein LOC142344800 isoform X2 n=1 Tax=Convolutriloba macropyga TaxID=536237 RepID=UPI003F52476A